MSQQNEDFFVNEPNLSQQTLSMLNSIPFCTALLSDEYKLVFCNSMLMQKLSLNTLDEILTERPGNFFKCVNTSNGIKCGSTNKCHECSLNRLLLEYDRSSVTSLECRIINHMDSMMGTLELKVHLSPVSMDNTTYVLMMLENINHVKRTEMLNRTFLHDVLNTACGLTSLTDYFGLSNDSDEFNDFSELLKRQTMYLIEEIKAHKDMVYGQTENAEISKSYCLSEDILRCSLDIVSHFAALNRVIIEIEQNALENSVLFTDPTLIRRVLVNLFKNAVESADEKETIHAGCRIIDDRAVFYIKNKRAMDEETKNSIFNRIYSTKQSGSGLGTVSIKLLTEKYLEGTVNFSSDEISGTIFYISLPTANPAQAVDDIIESKGHTLS